TFSAKVGFAREAGAIGVVIVNNRDPDSADGKFPIVMGGALVDLPAVMISRPQGAALKASMAAGEATARIAPDTTRYLGSFDGGRGASDSIFAFNVAQAGVYPLRLVWFEGGGGANLEWFSVTAAGEKVPLNAPGNPAALKAFRARAFVPPPPVDPTVAAAYDGTDVVITFQGKLQSSPTVDGPFTDVTATSPLRVPAASAAGNLFYRARR
ncbi:MAG: PA domain-containing protein, partial [Verrucomicrobiota bacterium]